MRACSGVSRKCCCARARRSCATSAGSSSRCTAAARSARTCSRRLRRRGRDRRPARRDRRSAPRRPARAALRVRRADPARLALLPELRARARRRAATAPRTPDARRVSEQARSRDRAPRIEAAPAAAPRVPASRTTASSAACACRRSAGRLASLRRGWLRRVGWYPGDWIWVGLPTLVVAVAGRGRRDRAHPGRRLERRHDDRRLVEPAAADTARPRPAPRPPTPLSAPEPGGARRLAGRDLAAGAERQANGKLSWPPTTDGWTIVLVSYPADPRPRKRRSTPRGAPPGSACRRSACSSRRTSRACIPGYASSSAASTSSRADAEAALDECARDRFRKRLCAGSLPVRASEGHS